MTAEKYIEELLHEAYTKGIGIKVINKASDLLKNGINRYEAFSLAYKELTEKIRFTENDIKDKDRLNRMIKNEAIQIYNSPVARRGRDLETIEFFVKQGKVAELYLIENQNYSEANRKWHDLKDPNGDYTEVKAYSNTPTPNVPYVEKDLIKYKQSSWNYSKWYILFNVDENGVYEFVEKIKI